MYESLRSYGGGIFLNTYFINKNFSLLLCGKFISEIGDKFYALALAFWVLETTGSASMMGLVLFCSMVPAIILGFFIGVMIDRYDRKALLVAADVMRGLIVAGVIVVYCMDLLSLPVIIAAQVLLSICSAFFDPAMQSVTPQVVDREQLAKANSLSSLAGGIAMIIGPALGGLSVAYFGYTFVFILNSLSFMISAIFTVRLRLPERTDKTIHEKRYKKAFLEGYKYIFHDKKLVIIIAVVALVHFLVGSVQVFIPVLAAKLPGKGAENLGSLQAFFGLGVIVTAFLLGIRKHGNREARSVFWGISGTGFIYVACGAVLWVGKGGILPFLVIFMLIGSSVILISTNYQTILQKSIPANMSGRVFSVTNALGDSSIPIAMLVFGVFLDFFPWFLLTTCYGISIMLISVFLFRRYGAGKDVAGQHKKEMFAKESVEIDGE